MPRGLGRSIGSRSCKLTFLFQCFKEQPAGSFQKIIRLLRGVSSALALVPSCCSKTALLNQARLNLRNPHLGLTQRFRACMYGVGAQDKVVIMRHSRAKDELCIGLGLEFDYGGRRLWGPQVAPLHVVPVQNGNPPPGRPQDSGPRGSLEAPPSPRLQIDG